MTGSGYYSHERKDVSRWLERKGPILDVGCGRGTVCAHLAGAGVRVVGVETVRDAAAEAAKRYADVHVGPFETFRTEERFAQVVLADVLEHMVDPWAALDRVARELLEPGGRVVVSVPNVRHWRVLFDLAVRDRWRYVDEGILDRTHLRFFTRSEGQRLIEGSGLLIDRVEPKFGHRVSRWLPHRLASRLAGLLTYQWLYVARLDGHAGELPSTA